MTKRIHPDGVRAWKLARKLDSLHTIADFFGARNSYQALAWCKERGYVLQRGGRLRLTNAGYLAVQELGVHGVSGEQALEDYIEMRLSEYGWERGDEYVWNDWDH